MSMSTQSESAPKPKPMTARRAIRAIKAAKFVKLVLEGSTLTEAWRAINPDWREYPVETQWSMASQLAREPSVAARLQQAAHTASVSTIDSHGRFHLDLLRYSEGAEHDGNYTALAALARVRGVSGSYLRENISVTDDRGGALAVLERLAKLAPGMADQLRPLLGHDGFAPIDGDAALQPSRARQIEHVQHGDEDVSD